jgi:hypothetical protein
MKDKQCSVVRRELEEVALNEEFSVAAAGHMRACVDCREFQRQQMKLRQIIGNLGTVNAPPDFDFRLRARLAVESERSNVRYWSFAVRGLATVAVLVVFGAGAVIVWQRTQDTATTVAEAPRPAPAQQAESRTAEQPRREEAAHAGVQNATPVVAANTHPSRNSGRPIVNRQRQTIASVDRSSERANVVSLSQPALDSATVFPIDASLQSVKVSLDDGHGNARTISFPTVSFGSQRVLPTGNQISQKHVW